jgi:hypothetical protein
VEVHRARLRLVYAFPEPGSIGPIKRRASLRAVKKKRTDKTVKNPKMLKFALAEFWVFNNTFFRGRLFQQSHQPAHRIAARLRVGVNLQRYSWADSRAFADLRSRKGYVETTRSGCTQRRL